MAIEIKSRKPRKRRKFDWKGIIGDKAVLATAIARRMKMNLPAVRRHLRWAVDTSQLNINEVADIIIEKLKKP